VIRTLRERCRGVIVGFKAEPDCEENKLITRAITFLKNTNLDFICANTLRNAGSEAGEVFLIDREGKATKFTGTKEKIAEKIFDMVKR
ncbi:MAG: phosphopantothenoylcysteine decarboxylase, partial [Thermoplasmata archaeon]